MSVFDIPVATKTRAGLMNPKDRAVTSSSTVQGGNMSNGSVDLSTGSVFTETITGNTTLSFNNAAPGYSLFAVNLIDADQYTITWPGSIVSWSGGSEPSGIADLLLFFVTYDGGTSYKGYFDPRGNS